MSGKYRTIVADPPWDHSDGTGVRLGCAELTGVAGAEKGLGPLDLPARGAEVAVVERLALRPLLHGC